jgi:uncharacterized membrane protein
LTEEGWFFKNLCAAFYGASAILPLLSIVSLGVQQQHAAQQQTVEQQLIESIWKLTAFITSKYNDV